MGHAARPAGSLVPKTADRQESSVDLRKGETMTWQLFDDWLYLSGVLASVTVLLYGAGMALRRAAPSPALRHGQWVR